MNEPNVAAPTALYEAWLTHLLTRDRSFASAQEAARAFGEFAAARITPAGTP